VSSSRSAIFARIRHASRGASEERIRGERDSLGKAPAAALPCEDLHIGFLANVLLNQGSVDCATSRTEAVKAVGNFLYQHYRSHRMVAGNDPRLAAMPWRDAGVLPRFGTLEPGESVALSYARLGVAEMGAIVTFTGKVNPSANNLLPEHHIVLLDAADLVPDLEAAWAWIEAETEKSGRPRGINFIAGPSSTADIEGQLVYGAHGPRGWHVILTGEVSGDCLEKARQVAGEA
jgi:L-lactate dehydrogenase complex protein LldG